MRMALVAATTALAALVVAAAGLADVSFTDPTGDQKSTSGSEVARAGPDITRVDVSNGQDGLVTFRITIANYRELPPNAFIAVFFDLDRNLETGDLGDEAQIGWSSLVGLRFERWDGQRMVAAPAGAIRANFSEGVFTLEVPRSELGGVDRFDFLIGASALVDTMLATDVAPFVGSHWTYNLVLGRLALRASTVAAVPNRPVAGRRFTVSTAVTRTDTRTAVRSGTVSCVARVGNAPLRAVGGFTAGRARCVLTVPATAAGKVLRGTLTIRLEGASVRRSYRFRVLAR